MTKVFIPSYHRADNLKTVGYLKRRGYDMRDVIVFVDDEADDIAEYEASCKAFGCELYVFSQKEARERYDYVHRPSVSRRSGGQARNMFCDYAQKNDIDFYCVVDDDTSEWQVRLAKEGYGYIRTASLVDILYMMSETERMMRERRIGVFGWAQTGDYIGGSQPYIFLRKVMNTTFYLLPYVYRGERGVLDTDTSLYCTVMMRGLFTGSYGGGLVLVQEVSATQKGGLTDLYHECKLLCKAMVVPIQYPSAVYAEVQPMNGGRVHHRIDYRYIAPKLIKGNGSVDNIAWDTYPEDLPFTNEPKRRLNAHADAPYPHAEEAEASAGRMNKTK